MIGLNDASDNIFDIILVSGGIEKMIIMFIVVNISVVEIDSDASTFLLFVRARQKGLCVDIATKAES